MRSYWMALPLAVALAGCGNSTSDVSSANVPQQSTTVTTTQTSSGTLQLNASNAQTAGQAIVNAVLTNRTADLSSLLNNGTSSGMPNALAESLVGAITRLQSAVGQTISGPNGGTVQVTGTSGGFTATFTGFSVGNDTFNGSFTTTALPSNGQTALSVSVQFNQFKASVNGQTFQLDGQINLQRTTTSNGFTDVLTGNFTATTPAGSLTTQNLVVTTNVVTNGSSISGTHSYSGGLNFQGLGGLTGTATISTPTPVAFSGPPPTVSAGQVQITGVGTLQLTVTGTNTLQVAVAPQGSSGFTTVNTISLTQ